MSLPPLNAETAAPGTPLNGYDVTYDREVLEKYAERTGEDLDLYVVDGRQRVPTGVLFGAYGKLIHETFHYEAGVHTSSELELVRAPWMDEPLRVEGTVQELFERNGNKYVRFSVEVSNRETGERVATVMHTSIYALQKKTAS